MLKKLVKERVRLTEKEKFSLQDIKQYSDYLNIPMTKLLMETLEIDHNNYEKLIKGTIININSEKYNKQKDNYIKAKRNIYKYRINWYKRTYFNREKLEKKAEKFQINIWDFSAKILGKSKYSTRNVIKDISNTKRFYVGKYVNARLPNEYFEKNINQIDKIIKCAVRKANSKFGRRIYGDEFKEEVQKGAINILYNGNDLNKNGIPIIKNSDFKPRHGKKIYFKALYYEIGEIRKKYFDLEYNDKRKYVAVYDNYLDLKERLNFNEYQLKLADLIIQQYCPEEICSILNISYSKYEEELNKLKAHWHRQE